MNTTAPADATRHAYPPGFRARRGLNWFILGLMYASYYMCRYNFRFATPGMVEEFGFNKFQITSILAWWSVAYGFGQLINGLLTDRIGGRTAMLIGAVGTITINLIYGFSSTVGTFSTFALIWLLNGYFQSFGAPGMIKINAAWFNRTERGTFAGIFGFMIQMGQIAINNLAPIILAGFTVGAFVVAEGDWRWLFIIPPIFTAVIAVLVAFIPKESPEAAGYPGLIHDELSAGDTSTRATIKESFVTIFKHPLVWFYAAAYACTGAVRNSSDQLSILYFVEQLHLDMSKKPAAVFWTLNLMPMVAVFGSLASGIISDKFFKGHRSPVAMGLYFGQTIVILIAAAIINTGIVGPTPSGIFLGCLFLILISLTVNSTHSLVGAAAPMDIGGRKMAGFASGVIDSFQYFGTALALPVIGWLLDKYGWGIWYPTMAGFGVIGGLAMIAVIKEQKRIHSSQPSELAFRGSRIGAFIIDLVAMFLIACVPQQGFAFLGRLMKLESMDILGNAISALGVLVLAGFQIYWLSSRGQTLGKRALGIRVVNSKDGGNPGFFRAALIRGLPNLVPTAIFVVSVSQPDVIWVGLVIGACFVLLNLLAIFGKQQRCIHDYIAGTKVINQT